MPRGKTKFDKCVKAVRRRGGAYDPRAVCGAMRARGVLNPEEDSPRAFWKERNDGKYHVQFVYPRSGQRVTKIMTKDKFEEMRASGKYLVYHSNPADSAAEAYKRFHGQDPQEFVTVTRKVHRHANLWSLGELRLLRIRSDRAIVSLSKFGGALLAANEQSFRDLSATGRAHPQLFIEGGDQAVNLRDFGIDPDEAHEVETLGQAIVIDYKTVKVHLGDEGGDAVYRHKFRTTRTGDATITLRIARYPDVIYRVLDKQLEFSGGSYEIRAEGIDK